jgi:hypothetical protein
MNLLIFGTIFEIEQKHILHRLPAWNEIYHIQH